MAGSAVDPPPPGWNDPVEQWAQVTFSHQLHLGEVDAPCAACHAGAASSERSQDLLLPKHPECAACHDVEAAADCATCHPAGSARAAFAAPERKIHFNHRLHMEKNGQECSVCHPGMAGSDRPNLSNLPAMAVCSACHDGGSAPSACETCHAGKVPPLPPSHAQGDWLREHKRVVRAGGESDCASCHVDAFCQSCHADPSLQFTEGDSPRPLGELRPSPWGSWPLVIQRVHGLNHRFGHSLDLRGKTQDCYTCHDASRFCSGCHALDQDGGFSAPFPEDHQSPDFVRLGVGSGGGHHADLARRDIESCASCHDVEGRDPACITCHVDRNPGKGNDPRTHPSGFLQEHGEWHSNPGAVCFNCHTDTGRAGLGFCGYCHGASED
jgi:hypothetical protein